MVSCGLSSEVCAGGGSDADGEDSWCEGGSGKVVVVGETRLSCADGVAASFDALELWRRVEGCVTCVGVVWS